MICFSKGCPSTGTEFAHTIMFVRFLPSVESTLLHSISPLRSLLAKMEVENLRFWKQSLLLTASTQRVERRTIHFPHTTPIRNYVRL